MRAESYEICGRRVACERHKKAAGYRLLRAKSGGVLYAYSFEIILSFNI